MHGATPSIRLLPPGLPTAWKRLLSLVAAVLTTGCSTPSATIPDAAGRRVVLLGHDPVAYFTDGRPVRYEPQVGGFCASGAAFVLKLGSDPTAFELRDGRLFIFGDVIGHEMWRLDPAWNVRMADAMWPQARDVGWRRQSLGRYVDKVQHYRTGAELMAGWRARNPGRELGHHDPGGMVTNLFLKPPGWRVAEGFGHPALGYPR